MTNKSKEPRTVLLVTFIQSIIITVLVTLIAGVCIGYIVTSRIQSTARAQAIQDVQVASKPQQ